MREKPLWLQLIVAVAAIFITMMLLLYIIAFIDHIITEPEPTREVCGFASQVEYENFKRLHRFHGTLSSFDIDGNCVYMRDGQLCSLWDPLVRTDR